MSSDHSFVATPKMRKQVDAYTLMPAKLSGTMEPATPFTAGDKIGDLSSFTTSGFGRDLQLKAKFKNNTETVSFHDSS